MDFRLLLSAFGFIQILASKLDAADFAGYTETSHDHVRCTDGSEGCTAPDLGYVSLLQVQRRVNSVAEMEGSTLRKTRSEDAEDVEEPPEVWKWVDVFIGTGKHGHTFPGATTPWGMVQATPWIHDDDGMPQWDFQSGYHSNAASARFHGIAHTALSGAGTGELGELRLLPGKSLFLDQSSMEASPGYFAAAVSNEHKRARHQIKIESSATPHGAIHKFAFDPSTSDRKVGLWLSPAPNAYWGYELAGGSFEAVSNRRLEGCGESLIKGFGHSMSLLCFVIEFDHPFLPVKARNFSDIQESMYGSSKSRGIDLDFTKSLAHEESKQLSVLVARVSVSRSNIKHARAAFSEELEGRDFHDILHTARRSWDKALGVIQIDMQSPSRKKMFYTALYHSLLFPNLLSDSDGSYRLQRLKKMAISGDMGGPAVDLLHIDEGMPMRKAKGHAQYGTFSYWDTYRSLHPLISLVHPEVSRDFGQSLLAFAKAWDFLLPPWQLIQSPSDMMHGDSGSIVLATMAMQGLVNKSDAFNVLNHTRRLPVDERIGHAFKPSQVSVSNILEQGMADSCASRLAHSLDLKLEETEFLQRSRTVRDYWDAKNKFFSTSRDSTNQGTLSLADLSREEGDAYQEGTPLQYSFAAQYDVQWQIGQRGGAEGFVCALDDFFESAPEPNGDQMYAKPDVDGNLHGATFGNEPSLHTPYLYALAGYPSRTQDFLDKVVKKFYADTPEGLPGNDDLGQMSSWLVFSLLGFYPADPCSNDFVLGRPFVNGAHLSVSGGKLEIVVHEQAEENKYVKSVHWQGQPLDMTKPVISFAQLSQGGVLEFWMSSTPETPRPKCSKK
jgi:putative alpha-1,2-mannosidase